MNRVHKPQRKVWNTINILNNSSASNYYQPNKKRELQFQWISLSGSIKRQQDGFKYHVSEIYSGWYCSNKLDKHMRAGHICSNTHTHKYHISIYTLFISHQYNYIFHFSKIVLIVLIWGYSLIFHLILYSQMFTSPFSRTMKTKFNN